MESWEALGGNRQPPLPLCFPDQWLSRSALIVVGHHSVRPAGMVGGKHAIQIGPVIKQPQLPLPALLLADAHAHKPTRLFPVAGCIAIIVLVVVAILVPAAF